MCKEIAQQADDMINAAKNAGLKLTGGGYRTYEEQIEKRKANCNGNIWDPCYRCRIETAIPGHSMHERGKAIDFYCNGVRIPKRAPAKLSNPCFIWLSNNANKYGFYNLPSEGWHWSTNGQ